MADPRETLSTLLRALVERGGRALHLTAGAPPGLRIDNELVRLETPPLEPSEVEQLVFSAPSAEQRKRFDEELELDYALHVPGLPGRPAAPPIVPGSASPSPRGR